MISPYGSVTPPVGVTNYLQGAAVTCAVGNSPVTSGTTQYVCTGWTRTGSGAGTGTGTNSAFTMTADTVHAWSWQTNYYLQTQAGANGTVGLNGTWWRSPSNATVTATPAGGYQLAAWSGDVPSGLETNNPLVMPMDRPRSVTATFAPVVGLTAVWANPSGGYWSAAANWLNNLTPGPGTNVDIDANGSYTSIVQNANACASIALGTTSSSGTQTLLVDSSVDTPLTCSNLTVGARGIFSYSDKCNVYGTGLVLVASGGQLYRRSSQYQGDFHGHDITVQAGGRWTIESNALHSVASDPGRDVTYTINGALDGGGSMDFNNPNNRNWITGAGRVDVARITLNNYNGNLYLGGTLTVNSAIIQSNAVQSAVVLTNGSTITLNGPYLVQGAGSALLVYGNTDSVTVAGTNLISVRHDDNGSYGVFTGAKLGSGGAGGNITIAGSGNLEVYQASALNLQFMASVLNLQRNSRFWATTNAAAIRPGTITINANGPGTTMTLDTNITLRLWNPGIILNVTSGASLALRNAIVEGGNNSAGGPLCTNVYVGGGSAAALALKANSTNTFRRSAESAYPLCVFLGANATLSAEAGSVLQLQECHLAMGFTNTNAWSWNTSGMVVIGSNVLFEAMNTDRGLHYPTGTADRSIKQLRLQSAGDLVLTLSNEGALDNDADGITDSALYVALLDLSGMPAGTTATLAGNGIAAPKLYYRWLSNPNGATPGAGFVALPVPGTLLMVQ